MADIPARLIADIGGTNARFALVDADGRPVEERKLLVRDFPGLVEAAATYLGGRRVAEAVIAVATPVEGDAVALMNSPWRFSIAAVRGALGLDRLAVINDFVAQSLAVTRLAADDLVTIQAGEPHGDRPAVVIGPGTGLGVGILMPDGATRRVLPSEGGHASFAPAAPLETEILRVLQGRFGAVSTERLVSGPGLVNIAQAIATVRGTTITVAEPADVTGRAAAGTCPICAEALEVFAHALGAAAGNLALALLARGGVYVTGGLCRRLGPLLDRDALVRGFLAKGRFEPLLRTVPIRQVTAEHTGLIGAAAYRLEPAR
jgi:glucokinase